MKQAFIRSRGSPSEINLISSSITSELDKLLPQCYTHFEPVSEQFTDLSQRLPQLELNHALCTPKFDGSITKVQVTTDLEIAVSAIICQVTTRGGSISQDQCSTDQVHTKRCHSVHTVCNNGACKPSTKPAVLALPGLATSFCPPLKGVRGRDTHTATRSDVNTVRYDQFL